MTSSPDAPLVVFPFGEPDLRLEDYFDDKLQSTADFDTLDSLLASVHEQHVQLQAQLDDAARDLDAARGGRDRQRAALARAIDEFEALEQTISSRLATANAADAAPEAVVARLQGPLGKLQRAGLAHDYLVLLRDVGDWAAAARQLLPDHPKEAALGPYARLRKLATVLAQRRGAADEAATHLVAHVSGVADALWAEMNQTMRDEFERLLEQRGWPARVDAAVPADETWRDGFAKLVDLQVPEILLRSSSSASSSSSSSSPSDPLPLLPIDVMAQIFVKEFRYHFLSSTRKTSDPRQIGEVCFPWFLDRVEQWSEFLRASFADLLADRFAGTAAAGKMVYVDPACAFVAALLPVMREKVQQTAAFAVQELRQQQEQQQASQAPAGPTFLSSFIVQLLAFDDEVRTRFGYDGGADGEEGWPGLAAAVLDEHFQLWLQAEKDYALARYREIVEGPAPPSAATAAGQQDPRGIDYDYHNTPGRTKPTVAAVRVVDLLRAVTDQYRRVRRFGQRLRFLIDIQITLLDAYDDRLRGSLEAYYAMTSTVGRTLHGVTKEQLAALEGTGGLDVLCRVFGSADHVVNALRDWGDEEFFVVLWDELQTRARSAEDHSSPLAAGLSTSQVRERTSSVVGKTNGDGGNGNGGEGSGDDSDATGILFDETIQAFSRRRQTAQEFLVAALADSHRKAFRPYVLRTHWTPVAAGSDEASAESLSAESPQTSSSAAPDPADLAITAELDEPLRVLKRNLAFLARALGTAPLRRITRGGLEKLQDMLWGEVLLAQRFTALGAAQLARDVAAVAAVVEQHVPQSSRALEGLREGVRLLNLPAVAAEEEGTITLQQASDRVYTDNAEAKKVLQELGLATLTPASARLVLQRRVENSG